MRTIANTFNIMSINYVLEQDCKEYFVEGLNGVSLEDYEVDDLFENHYDIMYSYDYESEIFFLTGKERKKFLKHCKNYCIDIYGEDEYNYLETNGELNSFFKIATFYANTYNEQNRYDWYKEWKDTIEIF